MRKYSAKFIMDGGNDTFTIETIIESNNDCNMVTSEIVKTLHSAEFFTANRDPEYYSCEDSCRVAIRTGKVISVVVRERR